MSGGRGIALLLLLLAACSASKPSLPGDFLGSFSFQDTLELGADGGPASTTCLLDAGTLPFPSTYQFFALVSLVPDAGQVLWQLGSADPQMAPLVGNGFSIVTQIPVQLAGCGCTAKLVETISLGAPPGQPLALGVSSLGGTIDDRLDPDPSQTPTCSADAGAGCDLACDLVYAVQGVPGQP